MKSFFLLLFSIALLISCNSSSESALQTQINTLLESHNYNEALQVIQAAPSTEETQKMALDIRVANGSYLTDKIESLKKTDLSVAENVNALVKAHVDFGIFLEYYGEHLAMKDRMTNSLAHFRRALQLDPQNEKAQAEIAQIESVYASMGRPVPQEIAD